MHKLTHNIVAHINANLNEKNIPYKLYFKDELLATFEPKGSCACEGKSEIFSTEVKEEFKKYGLVADMDFENERIILTEKVLLVVAAVIKDVNSEGAPIIFATQRGYGDFKGGWEFPGGKVENGEAKEEALIREIKEELDTVIEVGDLIETVEYDYPQFHLSMDCFMCSIKEGNLVLKEHEAAKWLTKDELDSVEWLPADEGLVEKIRVLI